MKPSNAASRLKEGRIALGEKDFESTRQLFHDALESCGPEDSQALRGEIHVAIGKVERDLGQNERASRHYRSASDIYRGLNDRMNLAHAVRHVADIMRQMGRLQDAEPLTLEAIDLYRAERPLPQLHLANSLRVAALLKEQAGNDEEALPLWVEARDLYRQVGVDAGVAESRAHLASVRGA